MILNPETNEELQTLIETSELPVLLDFYATWCGPCKMLAPVLDKVDESMGDKVQIIKIDTDKISAAAQKFGVRGIPTLVLLNGEEELVRKSGAMTKTALETVLEAHLS
jgi:thioredoxin 1